MTRRSVAVAGFLFGAILLGSVVSSASAQVKNFAPVTDAMLLNPSLNDWLLPSRTYDFQRLPPPFNQLGKQNVAQLRMAWARGMSPGMHENIPIVYLGGIIQNSTITFMR